MSQTNDDKGKFPVPHEVPEPYENSAAHRILDAIIDALADIDEQIDEPERASIKASMMNGLLDSLRTDAVILPVTQISAGIDRDNDKFANQRDIIMLPDGSMLQLYVTLYVVPPRVVQPLTKLINDKIEEIYASQGSEFEKDYTEIAHQAQKLANSGLSQEELSDVVHRLIKDRVRKRREEHK